MARRLSKKGRRKRRQQIVLISAAILIIAAVVAIIVVIANASRKDSPKAQEVSAETRQAGVQSSAPPGETAGDPAEARVPGETGTEAQAGADVAVTEAPAEAETEAPPYRIAPKDNGETRVTPENWNGCTVFLTFDDGPSENTWDIMDVLDEYGVKATFFVLGNASADTYKEMIDRGHAIGVHSLSHVYSEIYASYDAFVDDVSSLRQLLYEYTGVEPYLYRFPGGSNNQVHSDNVSMTKLADYLESVGMKYVDWNASSGDAGASTVDAWTIADNSISGIRGDRDSGWKTIVLLMHDANTKYTAADALREIIPTLLEDGFAFDKIYSDTFDVRFVLPD